MGKHLVLVGGGHAHMVTLANLHKFIEKLIEAQDRIIELVSHKNIEISIIGG